MKKIVTVKAPKSDNVSILKEKIKEKKSPRFDHLAASNLILYKVSLSNDEVDSYLKEANTAMTHIYLKPLKKLKEVFPDPLQEDLIHIIFEHDSGTCPRHWWISSCDMNY